MKDSESHNTLHQADFKLIRAERKAAAAEAAKVRAAQRENGGPPAEVIGDVEEARVEGVGDEEAVDGGNEEAPEEAEA